MTLQSLKLVSESIAILTLAVCAGYATYDLHQTQLKTRTTLDAANGTLQSVNATLQAVNAPCVGFHGSESCGPLAQLAQTEKNVGILAGQGALQAKQNGALLNTVLKSVNSATSDVRQFTQTATGTAQQVTDTLGTAQKTIAAGKPLLESLTRTSDAFNASLGAFTKTVSDPVWHQVGMNVVGMTHSGDLILADGSRVSKKFADDYTKHRTPWMRFWHYAGDTYDLAAFGARHTP